MYTQVYLCVHLYICAYICVCVHTFVYLCICVYICVFVCTFVYLWLHLRMCAYIHVYLCVHLRICAHTQPGGSPIRITPSPDGVLPCPEHRTRCLHRPLLISNPFSRLNMFPSILFSHLSIFTPLTVKNPLAHSKKFISALPSLSVYLTFQSWVCKVAAKSADFENRAYN